MEKAAEKGATRTRRQKGPACIYCRQMKLKCDAGSTFPAPCTRCTKSEKRCRIDPSFRRTARRNRLDELEREMLDIKSSMGPGGRFEDAAETPASASADPGQPQQPLELPTTAVAAYDIHDIDRKDAISTQALGGFEMTPDLSRPLIKCFYKHFHQRFPVGPDLSEFLFVHAKSPLVFWAVICVASKCIESSVKWDVVLAEEVRGLALRESARGIPSLALIQSLLLLCVWPLPFKSRASDDVSWLLCGIATHKAMQIGLHQPKKAHDFVHERMSEYNSNPANRRLTWLACYLVNQNLSAVLGIPSTISPDSTILEALSMNEASVPKTFKTLLSITYKSSMCTEMLAQLGHRRLGSVYDMSTIMKLFDDEVEIMQFAQDSSFPAICKMVMHGRRILLCSLGLQSPQTRTEWKAPQVSYNLESALFAHQAYASSMSLTAAATSDSEQHSRWTFLETYYLMASTMVLIKIMKKTKTQDPSAKQALTDSWRILKGQSRFENDFYSSMCDLIEYIGKVENDLEAGDDDSNDDTCIDSRGALSLAVETIRQARRRLLRDLESSVQKPEHNVFDSFSSVPDNDSVLGGTFQMDPGLDFFWDDWAIGVPDLAMDLPQI